MHRRTCRTGFSAACPLLLCADCTSLLLIYVDVHQGGYLGKAQGWTNRVTNNLQGQAEHLKGKFAGSGTTVTLPTTACMRSQHSVSKLAFTRHASVLYLTSTIRMQGQGSATGTGLNTTGTRTGYEPTGTGTGYSSTTGTTGYSDPNTGYSTGGNQPGVAHGHNAHLSQGYAPAQATTGGTTDGTYGHTAQVRIDWLADHAVI